MTRKGTDAARRSWLDIVLAAVAGLFALGFFVGYGARAAILLPYAVLDDALSIRLGRSLAAGQWLGPYDHTTLVKGVGFPVFLALNNLSGLPYVVGLALFHIACFGFAAWVLWRVLGSRIAAVAVLGLLLLMPSLYSGDLMRVSRDAFYMPLVVALIAAAIALASGVMHRVAAALLTGVLFAWAWLTREEGVWLLPPLLILALLPLVLRPSTAARPGLRGLPRLYAPFAGAALVAAVLVGLVGGMNQAVYGRFVINEIKDPVFQDAMDALQEASAPYAREMIPVPREARARIYAVSPTFATLRNLILDGPQSENYTVFGCQLDKRFCGDFGGGWFIWFFRESAAQAGQHQSLKQSRDFYRKITTEVRQACDDGRLTCRRWDVPLVPPMQADQVDDVAASAGKAFRAMTFNEAVGPSGVVSDLSTSQGEAMDDFLNRPNHGETQVTRRLMGWFREVGPSWFELVPADGVQVKHFARVESADLAVWFKDPGLLNHRYQIHVQCPGAGACPVDVKLESGATHRIDLAEMKPGRLQPLGRAEMYVDAAEADLPQAYLRTAFSKRWVEFASQLSPLYRALLIAGGLAFAVMLARAVVTRRLSVALVVCTALAAAVATRIVILALIDALSFPAANVGYGLPAMPLLVLFAVVALHDVLTSGADRLRRFRRASPA